MPDDDFGRSAIHYAAADGDAQEVARLLAAGADPNEPDATEFTPLHLAAQEQHPDVVTVLVEAGADVARTDRWGNTPLWRAVFTAHGSSETTARLIAAGADLDAVNATGVSPRDLAGRMRPAQTPAQTP